MLLDHITDPGSSFVNDMSTSDFYTSSPTVVLPATQPNQFFGGVNCKSTDNITMSEYFNATHIGSNGSITPSAGALAGRKRTRDDEHSPEDHGVYTADGSVVNSNVEGSTAMNIDPAAIDSSAMMVDLSESTRPVLSNSNSSDVDPTNAASRQERPSMSSRKSQRVTHTKADDDHLAQLVLPAHMREATTEPLIDEATRTLGISWARMNSSEALMINQAAYSKWIQNHYPSLDEVTVWFENSALPGYLVSAKNAYNGQQEFYIFSHDLTEARLVTADPNQLIPRLTMLPALHLAAPGGHIRAELHASMSAKASATEDFDSPEDELPPPPGICAAHTMEME